MTEFFREFYDLCEGLSLAYLVLSIGTLFWLLLLVLNYFFGSVKLAFFSRWLRLYLEVSYIQILLKFAVGLGGDISLFALSLLIAFLLELSYIQIKASLYSKRGVLPFSNLMECENAWRQGRKFYNLKTNIEALGFEKLKSFKAINTLHLATLFYNKKDKIALLVCFKLYGKELKTFFYYMAKSESAKYLIFTNDFSQDLLFLKENFSLHYRHFASYKSLFKKQKAFMKYYNEHFVDFEKQALDMPYFLYEKNLSRAFRANIYKKDAEGGDILTPEGKFQFCKKLIVKNYFRI